MDEEAAVLAAIAAHPAEDTPRLAYADWLDDHANALPDPPAARVRAEFIRVQCELKKYESLPSSQQQGYADIYRRQDTLLTHFRRELLGPLGPELDAHDLEYARFEFDRGFLTGLGMTERQFLLYHDAVDRLRPKPRVRVAATHLWRELIAGPSGTQVEELVIEDGDTPPAVFQAAEAAELAGSPHLGRLEVLVLGDCRVGDEGLAAIASSPNLPALWSLDASHNEVTDEGVRAIVASPLWPRLRYLVLGANPISDDGAFALADAPPTALEYLNVKFTNIEQAGQRRLLRRKGWKVDLF